MHQGGADSQDVDVDPGVRVVDEGYFAREDYVIVQQMTVSGVCLDYVMLHNASCLQESKSSS